MTVARAQATAIARKTKARDEGRRSGKLTLSDAILG